MTMKIFFGRFALGVVCLFCLLRADFSTADEDMETLIIIGDTSTPTETMDPSDIWLCGNETNATLCNETMVPSTDWSTMGPTDEESLIDEDGIAPPLITDAPTSAAPSAAPTIAPTVATPEPTVATPEPTAATPEPTAATPEPTAATPEPTAAPVTAAPSAAPVTAAPTTAAPSVAPVTAAPTESPTVSPTDAPDFLCTVCGEGDFVGAPDKVWPGGRSCGEIEERALAASSEGECFAIFDSQLTNPALDPDVYCECPGTEENLGNCYLCGRDDSGADIEPEDLGLQVGEYTCQEWLWIAQATPSESDCDAYKALAAEPCCGSNEAA